MPSALSRIFDRKELEGWLRTTLPETGWIDYEFDRLIPRRDSFELIRPEAAARICGVER